MNTWTTEATTYQAPIVFVVDEDTAVRQSLEAFIKCVGLRPECFASAADFLQRPPPEDPNCLLLDVSLSDLTSLDLQRQVASDRAETPVIFVSGCTDVRLAVEAMKAGAAEFLSKPVASEVLLQAIEQAIDRSRRELRNAEELRSIRSRYATLTKREREVMTLVVSGLLNKQVAAELELSEITVKAHRGRMMQKMKASSLPGLVSMAARLGLPSPRQ